MNRLLEIILFLLSLPFRLNCEKVGRNVMIGPGYSIFGCHLENVIIGDGIRIGSNAWIQTVPVSDSPKPVIVIEDNVNIGRNVTISAAKKISIGKDCLISYSVSIVDHNHAFNNPNISPLYQGIDEPEEINIGEDCFLGAHSFILKGVTLGKHCVVGANSVVNSSFPAFSVVAGIPAIKIRTLDATGGR
jgi:acetyltransferase-like isoleucine patch superfamily enzyme